MAIIKRAVAPAAVKEEKKTDVVKINPPVVATVSGSEVGKKSIKKDNAGSTEKKAEEKAEAEKAAKDDKGDEEQSPLTVKRATVEADNEQDFLAKILGINWDEIEAVEA